MGLLLFLCSNLTDERGLRGSAPKGGPRVETNIKTTNIRVNRLFILIFTLFYTLLMFRVVMTQLPVEPKPRGPDVPGSRRGRMPERVPL